MKTLLLLVVCTFAVEVNADSPPAAVIAIPEKCEDVLSVKVCDKLKSVAASIKLNAGIAKEAVANAVKKGKTTAEDIYNSVKSFYLEKIKDKECKDFLKDEHCQKLLDTATRISIEAKEVNEYVKQALISGKNKAEEVYGQVKEYFKTKFSGKTCEEILEDTLLRSAKESICKNLHKSATAIKVNSEKVRSFVKDTVVNGYKNAATFIKSTALKIKEYSTNVTKCENLLNPKVCATLRDYAAKTKVAFPKIMSTVRDLLMTGVRVVKGTLSFVYKITDAFVDCEHFFTERSCTLLKEKIAKVGGTLSDVGKAVRDIAVKVGDKVSDAYKIVVDYTKSKLCKYLRLSCSSTTTSGEKVIAKRSIGFKDLLNKYKNMLSSGIADAKKKLMESLNGVLDSMKIVDATVRKVVEEAIKDSKGKYEEIKDLLKKLMNTVTGSNSTESTRLRRDLRKDLEEALVRAHGHIKVAIRHLLTFTKQKLQKCKDYIHVLLKQVSDVARGKRETDDEEEVDKYAEALAEAVTEELELEAEDVVDNMIDQTITEIEDEIDIEEQSRMEKRDVTSAVNKAKEFFGKVGDKLNDLLSKIRSTNIEDIKNALKEGGMKLIGVAEDLLKKIQQALQE